MTCLQSGVCILTDSLSHSHARAAASIRFQVRIPSARTHESRPGQFSDVMSVIDEYGYGSVQMMLKL